MDIITDPAAISSPRCHYCPRGSIGQIRWPHWQQGPWTPTWSRVAIHTQSSAYPLVCTEARDINPDPGCYWVMDMAHGSNPGLRDTMTLYDSMSHPDWYGPSATQPSDTWASMWPLVPWTISTLDLAVGGLWSPVAVWAQMSP